MSAPDVTPFSDHARLTEAASRAVERAKAMGADAADALVEAAADFDVKVAGGAILTLTQANSRALGLRAFVGGRLGFAATTDLSAAGIARAAARAVDLARQASPDEHNGLPPGAQADAVDAALEAQARLDLFDPAVAVLSVEEKIRWAHEIERAARAAHPRVTRFRDSGVATRAAQSLLLNSQGVLRTQQSTAVTLWCNPIAVGDGGELQTESWHDARPHLADLEAVVAVGRTAGLRAARMLGARRVKTQRVAVIFEPHMTASWVAGLLPALDGDLVHKRASFLSDCLGEQIASPLLSLIDDPLLPRGLASAAFDGEGQPTFRKAVIDRGVLATFLYDSYTARKAATTHTANAKRTSQELPRVGAFNLLVAAGGDDPEEILRSVPRALLVTRGLGRGADPVSGEYSRGANGLWIEGGEIVHPVQEVTIAGDLRAMLKAVDRVGHDFAMRGDMGAPTVRIAEMTVSGA